MNIALPKWLVYALLAIFWWGIFGFLSKLGSENLSPKQMQIMFTAGVCTLLVPAWLRSGINVESDKLGLLYGTFTGLFAGIANIALFAALEKGQVSIIQPVTTLYPLVTVILAMIFLKERMNRLQAVGVVLALVAIWTLSI